MQKLPKLKKLWNSSSVWEGVRVRKFNAGVAKIVLLYEGWKSVSPQNVPPGALASDRLEAWTILVVGELEAIVEDFNSKLGALLHAEGRTKKDLQLFITTPSQPLTKPISLTIAILHGLGDLLHKSPTPVSDSGEFCQLKGFLTT